MTTKNWRPQWKQIHERRSWPCRGTCRGTKIKKHWLIIFSIKLWREMRSRFCTTTGDTQLNGWTAIKFHNTSQSQNFTKIRLWWLVVCSRFSSSQLPPSQRRNTAKKSTKCTGNCNVCARHWSTERGRFFSTTTLGRTWHNRPCRSWMSWATNTHLISPSLTTTSSSISTTSLARNASETKMMLKRRLKSLWYTTGINKLVSRWQKMCWFLIWGSLQENRPPWFWES